MRRIVFAMVTTLSAVVGGALLAAGPAAAHAEDNTTVCAAAKKAIETGGQAIMTDLRQASTQAAQGNNAAADATVKAMGPKFGAMGTSLQKVADTASDPELKSALTGLGTEFGKVGQSLTDLQSLQKVDESQIDAQGQRVSKICRFAPNPSNAPSTSATA